MKRVAATTLNLTDKQALVLFLSSLAFCVTALNTLPILTGILSSLAVCLIVDAALFMTLLSRVQAKQPAKQRYDTAHNHRANETFSHVTS